MSVRSITSSIAEIITGIGFPLVGLGAGSERRKRGDPAQRRRAFSTVATGNGLTL